LKSQRYNEIKGTGFRKYILPKATPVNMFHKPENTSVVESDIESLTARAIMSGRSVPRSPREPDISDRGNFRKVETLLVWSWRIMLAIVDAVIENSRY
jgi:hypothetical protein